MKYIIYIVGLSLIATSCMLMPVHKEKVCDCCAPTYTTIDQALNCLAQHPISNTSADHRLLLLTFVRQDIKAKQQLGWTILKDPKIITVAQRDYLLVTLDANHFSLKEEHKNERFSDVFLSHKNDSTFYMVVNQAVYPFRDWGPAASTEEIIADLQLGNGP